MKLIILFCFLVASKARLVKRIHGGIDTKLKKFPNVMSIQVLQNHSQEYEHICASTMVDYSWGLTTGQCLSGFDKAFPLENVRVKAGIWTVKVTEETEQISRIDLYFKHEQMIVSKTKRLFDIGLIKLATKLQQTEYVKLLPILSNEQMYLEGSGVIVGWGLLKKKNISYFWSDGLQMLKVPLLNILFCRTAIRNLVDKHGTKEDSDIINESHICSGPLNGKEFICAGDRGGPLYIAVGLKYHVIGIISYTILSTGKSFSPTIYTNISFYTKWIQDIIKKYI